MNSDLKNRTWGRFELLEKLGRGGMGVVYKAHDPHLDRVVALKILHSAHSMQSSQGLRFLREAQFSRNLDHPGLVKTLDQGVHDGRAFLVLEYISGLSVDQWIRNRGLFHPTQALDVFTQLSMILEFLHKKNIIHRDVKPGNILLEDHGRVMLADLGLMKDLNADSNLTKSRTGLGTYEYSAPEQLQDARQVDARTDLYSLGASLYMALTGRFPFGRGGNLQILERKLAYQFVPARHWVPELSEPIDQAICRSLHPDPDQRPANAQEFREALAGHLHGPRLVPALPANAEVKGRERRAALRYFLPSLAGRIEGESKTASAVILDVSTLGLSLRTDRPFEVGSVLEVQLPGETRTWPVRVRWLKEVTAEVWFLGCLFKEPLKMEEWERWCERGS